MATSLDQLLRELRAQQQRKFQQILGQASGMAGIPAAPLPQLGGGMDASQPRKGGGMAQQQFQGALAEKLKFLLAGL